MFRKYIILCASLAMLAGCTETSAVKSAVRDVLKDPDSAKFGEITLFEGQKGKHACATVNARNAMGGYTGDKQMLLRHDGEDGWTVVDELDDYTHEQCSKIADAIANDTEPK
jgi:hypothetical protein